MIAWLQGFIMDWQQPGRLVLNVNGVGYDVETSLQTFFQLETRLPTHPISLFIHTVVREDAFLLYGFIDKTERALFRNLIKINGIGPKVAMGILSGATPGEFAQAIRQQNAAFLSKLPGIGKKTAERILIELKDKLDKLMDDESITVMQTVVHTVKAQDEAIRALESLGYKAQEAAKVIKQVDDGQMSCEQLIRKGLQSLSRL